MNEPKNHNMPENDPVTIEASPHPENEVASLRETLEVAGRKQLEVIRLEKSRDLFKALGDHPGATETRVKSSGSERVVARQVALHQPEGGANTLRIVESSPVNVENPHAKIALYAGAEPSVDDGAPFSEVTTPNVFINTHERSIPSDSDYSLRDLQRTIDEVLYMDELLKQVEAAKMVLAGQEEL